MMSPFRMKQAVQLINKEKERVKKVEFFTWWRGEASNGHFPHPKIFCTLRYFDAIPSLN